MVRFLSLHRWRQQWQGSLRTRLLALSLVPMLVIYPLMLGILGLWGEAYFDRLLFSKVHSDLATASNHLEQTRESVANSVRRLGESERLLALVSAPTNLAASNALLANRALGTGLDYLLFVDRSFVCAAPSRNNQRTLVALPFTRQPSCRG